MTMGRLASPARMVLVAAVLFGFSTSAFATTFSYTYVGKNYDFNKPAPYNDAMTVTGTFTIDAPSVSNLAFGDHSADVVTYSFFDGVQTLTNLNSNIQTFNFST